MLTTIMISTYQNGSYLFRAVKGKLWAPGHQRDTGRSETDTMTAVQDAKAVVGELTGPKPVLLYTQLENTRWSEGESLSLTTQVT